MTKARAEILAVLGRSTEPLSASSVYRAVDSQFDQATVYRTLHYLEGKGLAESFILHCDGHGTERYYASADVGHRHWFHCESCHRFTDLGDCMLSELIARFELDRGVDIRSHSLSLTGVCAACKKNT